MKIPSRFGKHETILTVLFLFGITTIFWTFLSNLSFPDTSYNFLGKSGKVKLDSGKPITQVFTAQENNLNQIKVIIGNFDLAPRERIDFELMDPSCETVLARQSANFLTPDPQIYYRFNFPAIPDSAGQEYCFRATYFSPIDRGGERPYLAISEGEQFRGRSYVNEGNSRIYENRTLQMRPAYTTGSIFSDLGRLNDRISQYKPNFVKSWGLTLLFGAFLIGTFALACHIIRSKTEE